MQRNQPSSPEVSDDLVSVIIPAFNAANFVSDAISSVLEQSHRQIETIVVDDGSTDDTARVLHTFRHTRIVVLTQDNQGVASARNSGFEVSRGRWVAFLDADDLWTPDHLSREISHLKATPGAAAVGSLMSYVSPSGTILGTAGQPITRADRESIKKGALMPFPLSSMLFRRSYLERVGGFDTSLDHAEDLDLLARVAGLGDIDCIEEVLGAYRIHPGSATVTGMARQRMSRRFVQQRTLARMNGGDLSWSRFIAGYRPSLRDRHADLVAGSYRRAGLEVAEGRPSRAVAPLALAALMGPRYTVARLRRQRPWRRAPKVR